jgi:hypothetical protein
MLLDNHLSVWALIGSPLIAVSIFLLISLMAFFCFPWLYQTSKVIDAIEVQLGFASKTGH